MKLVESQISLFSCQKFPPKVSRMLTFVHDTDDTNCNDDATINTYTDDNDMHTATALLLLCFE